MLIRRLLCTTTRGFRVLGLQQVAIGGLSKDSLRDFWGSDGLLGISKVGEYRSDKENVDEDILQLGKGANAVEIDLMTPIDPSKSPKVHTPALNHIGLWVDDLHVAVEKLSSRGVIFTSGGIRKGAAGHNIAFIHPKSSSGVLVELVQAPHHIIEAFDTSSEV